MDSMQPTDIEPVLDAVRIEPKTQQLPPREDPVLRPSQFGNRHIYGTRPDLS